jgi:hypothetical protein
MEKKPDETFIRDVEAIVDYLWRDEERHFEESGCPNDHIFLVLRRLKTALTTN